MTLYDIWQYGLLNPTFWLFIIIVCFYVGMYIVLTWELYGRAVATRGLSLLRLAGFIALGESCSLLLPFRPVLQLELAFLAIAYDYVTIIVPESFFKIALSRANFLALLFFYNSFVFFAVLHNLTQLIFLSRLFGRWSFGAAILMSCVAFVSFTLAFVLTGYIYHFLA